MRDREEVVRELSRLREVIQSEVDLEPDEGDQQITEHETAAILAGILQHKLVNIEAALSSIELGEYSKCERCKRAIEPARLAAKPDARYCISCQTIVERIIRQNQMAQLSVEWDLFAEA
jgi:RNA polymerase-binding transcription factor DksA